ncbi:cohesin domain-containing protein [Desulfofustis limnaeus]|uniref:cohesin domain-containing protein n=1 Tax=Desulfofustis limnaeus TaxID=2740163 RepID=UPI0024DF95BE|nr:cohesin domain-containing protein [Desulfofustis limnaeus]
MRALFSRPGYAFLALLAFATHLLFSPLCLAASAHLRLTPQEPDTPEKIILSIDKVEKLAGMKITLTYDPGRLRLVTADKAEGLSSFMHVVNDQNPGTIIIVMASATGVSGTDLPLFHLEFSLQDADAAGTTTISVSHVQLMDENLQEILGDQPTYSF